MDNVYFCNGENKKCNSSPDCWKNGGPCHRTTDETYKAPRPFNHKLSFMSPKPCYTNMKRFGMANDETGCEGIINANAGRICDRCQKCQHFEKNLN